MKFCKECGKAVNENAVMCVGCGCSMQSDATKSQKSDKSKTVAILLCLFLGGFGAHRFYVGKIGSGVAMLFTLGGFGLWSLIDFISIICGNFTDVDRKKLA